MLSLSQKPISPSIPSPWFNLVSNHMHPSPLPPFNPPQTRCLFGSGAQMGSSSSSVSICRCLFGPGARIGFSSSSVTIRRCLFGPRIGSSSSVSSTSLLLLIGPRISSFLPTHRLTSFSGRLLITGARIFGIFSSRRVPGPRIASFLLTFSRLSG